MKKVRAQNNRAAARNQQLRMDRGLVAKSVVVDTMTTILPHQRTFLLQGGYRSGRSMGRQGGNLTTVAEVSTIKWPRFWPFRVGPFADCFACGAPTRSHLGDKPLHMHCGRGGHHSARAAPNRHERNRQGIPRPPVPEWVLYHWPERFAGNAIADAVMATVDGVR